MHICIGEPPESIEAIRWLPKQPVAPVIWVIMVEIVIEFPNASFSAVNRRNKAKSWHPDRQPPPVPRPTPSRLGLHSLILRRHDSDSWPTTPSGKTAREDRRAAHGTPGGPAGIAGIDTRSLARGQQHSTYGFMVFVPLINRCRGIETPFLKNQGVAPLKVSGTYFRVNSRLLYLFGLFRWRRD